MIKLLMGITLSEVGGSQKVVFNIIANLPEYLYDVTLITSPGGELLDWINELNKKRTNKVKVITLNSLCREISPICDVLAFTKLLLLLLKRKYDIAHFHNSKMGIIGRVAAKIVRLPRVYYTVHGWGLNKNTTGSIYGILSLLEKIVARFSTQVIFVSQSDLEMGISHGWALKTSAHLIYNGIDYEYLVSSHNHKILKLQDDLPVIAFVARLAEPKEPLFLIQVSAQLLRDGYNHMLVIIGDGPKYIDCINLIKTLGIEGSVVLLGKRNDVIELLKEVDVFCLFSKWEGLPISIIEAMLCGLPIVANDVGGIPELIHHGETGYLLNEFNVKKAALFLKDLITDKEKRLTIGNAARVTAYQNFNLAKMVSMYRHLYEEH